MSSGPIDMRLLKVSPAALRYVIGTGITQAVETALVVLRGLLLGTLTAAAITEFPMFHVKPSLLGALAATVLAHGGLAWVRNAWTARAAGATIHQLRTVAVKALRNHDPRDISAEAARWTVTLGRELEGLRPYLAEYIPALVAVCLSTPTALAVIFYLDRPAGWLALSTIPLIPIFMILIGKLTQRHTQARLAAASALQHRLADILGGAQTLRRYHREQAPRRELETAGTGHANTTMGVLRLAFLSSFALEFLATLSVALVAVSVGLRLLDGGIELASALIVLIIVPEVYAPLRAVGTSFHAAAEGTTAAAEALALIDTRSPCGGYRSISDEVACTNLSVSGREGQTPRELSFSAPRGTITVLSGPNGSGKSTTLLAIAGLLPDAKVSGKVEAPQHLAYLPAVPVWLSGSVTDNIVELGASKQSASQVLGELSLDISSDEPRSLSTGQAHRVAIARTLAHEHTEAVLLDEPSAHLSPELVEDLISVLHAETERGVCVIVASHDPRLHAIADQVVTL